VFIGATIRDARREAAISQAALAALAGTSQATLSAYEAGGKAPTVETLERLLSACGYRLRAEAAPRGIRRPSEQEFERRGRTLSQAISLAESLPARREPRLRYPRISELMRSR